MPVISIKILYRTKRYGTWEKATINAPSDMTLKELLPYCQEQVDSKACEVQMDAAK